MADTKQATELMHRLWYQGVRLRDEIKESLTWHPQAWNGPAVAQLVEAWDEVSQKYADMCLSSQPSQELRIPDDLKGWHQQLLNERNGCGIRGRITAEDVIPLIERIARLEGAIRWANGEVDEFPERKPGEGAYWWRKELTRRARLEGSR